MIAQFDFHEKQTVKRTVSQSKPAVNRFFTGWRSAWLFTTLLTGLFGLWVIYRWVYQPAWLHTRAGWLIDVFNLYELGSTITLLILWGLLIWRFIKPISHTNRLDLSQAQMYALSPAEFEHYIATLFRKKGYTVHERGRSGDAGVDLEIRNGGKRAIVQCKRYHRTVGAEVVRELYGTLLHEQVQHAFLVTTGNISPAARNWSQGKALTLIDGKTLVTIADALAKRP